MHRIASAAIALATLLLATPAVASPAATIVTHVVRPGETLFRIARLYGVTVEVVAQVNSLSNPRLIRPGQILRIPTTERKPPRSQGSLGAGRGSTETRAQASPKKQASKTAAPTRTVSYRYVVSRGDTLYALARRFGTTVDALRRTNGLQSDLIRPGQRLVIPGVKITPQVPPRGRTIKIKVPEEAAAESTPLEINPGDTVTIQRPLRVRRGPGTYFGTLALVAAETELWVTRESQGWFEVQLPGGDVGWARQEDLEAAPASGPAERGQATTGDVIVREAMQYLGTKYVWGGRSTSGLDCSGFVYAVFSAFSSDLLRLRSYDYFRMGVPVTQPELQPGDLVFFTTYAPGASHVGIYLGERKFIHASSGARSVAISSLDESYYTSRYVGARRLAEPAQTTP